MEMLNDEKYQTAFTLFLWTKVYSSLVVHWTTSTSKKPWGSYVGTVTHYLMPGNITP